MKIDNIFQVNDWNFKKFLIFVFMIQFATWGTIGLDYIGLQISTLRSLVAFIYLLFLPGFMILRCLKLHKLGNIKTLLYSVGLSISTLMLIGLFINTVYPFFNISKPLSLIVLITTISVVQLILIIICYMTDKKFSDPSFICIKDILSPSFLTLVLIFFLIIFGVYLVDFYLENILLMFLIFVISTLVLLIGFDYFIPSKYYPLTIFVIAISLLFHTSLITMYLSGWDIQLEYYSSNLTLDKLLWDPTVPLLTDSVLSIVMLAPIFSVISGLNLIWVFKIIYSLIYSLVPLGLYQVYQKQTNDKIAFLACFFFISLSSFYVEMPSLARQEIAELFLVLLILIMTDNNMDQKKRSILSIVFIFSLAVSHYSLSFIFLSFIFTTSLLRYFNLLPKHYRNMTNITKVTFVSLSFVIIFSWYIYISSANTFNLFILNIKIILLNAMQDLFSITNVQGLDILTSQSTSLLHEITKYIHIVSQTFITIGIIVLLSRKNKINMKFENEYVIFSILSYTMLLACLIVPFFASSLNTTRIYHLSLIFLSPFFVIGGLFFFNLMNQYPKVIAVQNTNPFKFLSIFLSIYLLFNSGWVYALTNDDCRSISLNITADGPHYNSQEILGAKWLNNTKTYAPICVDQYRRLLFFGIVGASKLYLFSNDLVVNNSYIYFGTLNLIEKKVAINFIEGNNLTVKYVSLEHFTFNKNKIYDNGGSYIYS